MRLHFVCLVAYVVKVLYSVDDIYFQLKNESMIINSPDQILNFYKLIAH